MLRYVCLDVELHWCPGLISPCGWRSLLRPRKAESLTSLFQALVIGASGIFIIWEAVHRIRESHQTRSELIGIVSMIIAIAASAWLVKRLRPAAKETESPALASDALHYVADIYINVGVLVALLLTTFTGWGLADPLISMAIALYILKAAFGLAHESINILMDRRLPVEVDHKVAELTRTRLTTLRLKRLS